MFYTGCPSCCHCDRQINYEINIKLFLFIHTFTINLTLVRRLKTTSKFSNHASNRRDPSIGNLQELCEQKITSQQINYNTTGSMHGFTPMILIVNPYSMSVGPSLYSEKGFGISSTSFSQFNMNIFKLIAQTRVILRTGAFSISTLHAHCRQCISCHNSLR